MPEINYIEPDGSRHTVEVQPGMTVMEGAVLNMLPGIEGMCGGMMSCATCHCFIDPEWRERIAPPSPDEIDMLDSLDGRNENSRLGCQVRVDAAASGLVVHLPEAV